MRALREVGCCTEHEWPLDVARINQRPPLNAEMSGIRFADVAFERVTGGPEHVLDALQLGHPVVFGVEVTSHFVACLSDDTIPAPKTTDVRSGGHCVLACGFDRGGARIRFLNSWSRDYGDNGFGWLDPGWFSDREASDIHALVRSKPAVQS